MVKKDIALLKDWVNPLYLLPENVKAIAKQFGEQGYVQLADFFDEKKAALALKQVKAVKKKQSYEPDLHRYSFGPLKQAKDLHAVVSNKAFLALLATMVDGKGKLENMHVFSFSQGSYTLLHDLEHNQEGILFWLDFTKDWEQEYGGMTVITSEEEDPLLFPSGFNSLHLVRLDKDSGMFTKYVNCLAKKKEMLLVRGWLE